MSDHELILLKLGMGRYPAVDVTVSFDILSEVCKYYFDKGTAFSNIVGSNLSSQAIDPANAIYIADFKDTKDFLSILFVRGDPGRPLPGWVNPSLQSVKQIDPSEPGYVPGGSSQFIVSKSEIASGTDNGRFRAALQRTRGISQGLVKEFLTQLLARFAEEYPHRFVAEKKQKKKGQPKEELNYRPTVGLIPQKNANLKDDLEKGRIGGFRLTRGTADFKGSAGEAKIQRMNVKLHASISPTEDYSSVKKLVDHVQAAMDKVSFESLNLELVDEQGEPVSSTQPIPIDRFENNGDLRYCKRVSVPSIHSSQNECDDQIFKPLETFAMKCLSNEVYWS